MRVIRGIYGVSDKLAKYRRAMDDVRLWHSEVMGVARTKNDIRAREFEE